MTADSALVRRADVVAAINEALRRLPRPPKVTSDYSDGYYDGLADLADRLTGFTHPDFQIPMMGMVEALAAEQEASDSVWVVIDRATNNIIGDTFATRGGAQAFFDELLVIDHSAGLRVEIMEGKRWQKSGIAVSPQPSQTPNTGSDTTRETPAKDGNDE